jgi:hypothetical protein
MALDLPPAITPITPITAACVSYAAKAFGFNEDIQYAVLIVEGGSAGKTSPPNKNNTFDIGPAQINSIHLPALKQVGISQEMLTNNGCLNIYVQAHFIATAIRTAGPIKTEEDYLFAIARYHSKNRSVAKKYVKKLQAAFHLIYQGSS